MISQNLIFREINGWTVIQVLTQGPDNQEYQL